MLQPSESEPTKKFLRCNFRGGWAGAVATHTLISTRASTQKTHATAFYPSGYCRFRGLAASFGG